MKVRFYDLASWLATDHQKNSIQSYLSFSFRLQSLTTVFLKSFSTPVTHLVISLLILLLLPMFFSVVLGIQFFFPQICPDTLLFWFYTRYHMKFGYLLRALGQLLFFHGRNVKRTVQVAIWVIGHISLAWGDPISPCTGYPFWSRFTTSMAYI